MVYEDGRIKINQNSSSRIQKIYAWKQMKENIYSTPKLAENFTINRNVELLVYKVVYF